MLLDILILLVVVLIIFHKLFGLLGTKIDSTATPISKESAAKIFDILAKESIKRANTPIDGGELNGEPKELSAVEKTLRRIPGFNQDSFLSSASKAFEMVVKAFAQGDSATLKTLVDKKLYENFHNIISQRSKEGITSETDLIGFENTEIINAVIDDEQNAKISVRFVSEQANVLRNAQGEVIEGDENFIQTITDVWTFERNLRSPSPRWLLVSTKK
ncbi:MAG: Tim44 domain-containing protein [Alphaproteobacteria bacterium]|nr:Tim44 domain-containing protein [Alphaproteobacteria bacterium]